LAQNIVKALFFLSVLFLARCDSYELFDLLDSGEADTSGSGDELSIVPISATVEVETELLFAASGGTPPYIFSIASGSGSINLDSGLYVAPADASIDIVQVTDGDGSQSQARVVVVF
jgi:hypothetical protein